MHKLFKLDVYPSHLLTCVTLLRRAVSFKLYQRA